MFDASDLVSPAAYSVPLALPSAHFENEFPVGAVKPLFASLILAFVVLYPLVPLAFAVLYAVPVVDVVDPLPPLALYDAVTV